MATRTRVAAARGIGLHPWHPVVLSLVVLTGCASNAPTETGHVADSGAASAGQTGPKAEPTPPPVAVAPTGNPNRLHQLKDLKRVDLKVNGSTVHAWVMDDEPKRAEGMMFLTDGEVKADEGMLFAFDSLQRKADGSGFWMHNTLIPLDIVYMTPQGKVLNIAHGKVQDDTSLPPEGDYQYVLELKAGTAARLGLKAGGSVTIPALPKG